MGSDKLAGVVMLNLVDDPPTDLSQPSITKHQHAKANQFSMSNTVLDDSDKLRDPGSTQCTNKYKSSMVTKTNQSSVSAHQNTLKVHKRSFVGKQNSQPSLKYQQKQCKSSSKLRQAFKHK